MDRSALVPLSVALAAALWGLTFAWGGGNFWLKIALAALILASIALRARPELVAALRPDARALLGGALSAGGLYGVFWLGKTVAEALLPFAQDQIGGVYARGEGTPLWAIALLLLFVTGPAEELYWRGFLQEALMRRCGGPAGWLAASALYAGVHLWTLNLMLIGAAAVAGAFWGLLYWRLRDLKPVIVSHALWSTVVFAVFPLL